MESATRSEISLEKLRQRDAAEWEKAFPELWAVAWRTVAGVSPYATDTEKEEFTAAALSGENKVVSQITNPSQKAFKNAKTFDDILNLTSTVARNTTVDEIRKSTTRADETNQRRVESLFGNDGANPGEQVQKAERLTALGLAIAELNENRRYFIEDYYFENLSTEQIANKRGKPKGTVCVELSRARAELLTKLESDQD